VSRRVAVCVWFGFGVGRVLVWGLRFFVCWCISRGRVRRVRALPCLLCGCRGARHARDTSLGFGLAFVPCVCLAVGMNKLAAAAAAAQAAHAPVLSPEEATEMNATDTATLTALAAAVDAAEARHERACDAHALAEFELETLAAEVKAFGKPRRGSAMYEVECDQLDELESDLRDARKRVARLAGLVTSAEVAIDAAVTAHRFAVAEAEGRVTASGHIVSVDAERLTVDEYLTRAEAAGVEPVTAAILATREAEAFEASVSALVAHGDEVAAAIARNAEAQEGRKLAQVFAQEEAEAYAAAHAAYVTAKAERLAAAAAYGAVETMRAATIGADLPAIVRVWERLHEAAYAAANVEAEALRVAEVLHDNLTAEASNYYWTNLASK